MLLFTPGVKEVVQGNSWMLFPAFLLSMGLLIALHVKRKETPINLILLAAFTVVEVITGPYRDSCSSHLKKGALLDRFSTKFALTFSPFSGLHSWCPGDLL